MPGYFIKLRYLFVSLVCAVIALLLYYQDILPLYQQLYVTQDQEKQLNETLHKLYYEETALEEKMPQLPATKAILSAWQKEFIKHADVDKLVKMIIITGKKNKLAIVLTGSAPVTQENNYLRQPFKFILRGDYGQIVEFIKQVASLPWLVSVDRFTVSELSPSLFAADVEFDIFYSK